MASACDYADQLLKTAASIVEATGYSNRWQLVYQSRSGSPSQPWLEPDI